MRTKLLLAALVLAATGLVAGCAKDPVNSPSSHNPPGSSLDQARVANVLGRTPQVIEDGQFESSEVSTAGASTPGAFAAINPLRFWRTITDVDRSFEFAFSDTDSTGRPTKAIVTVHKRLTGSFNILTGVPGTDGTPLDSTTQVIHKPLADHWVRRILLKRVASPESDEDGGWRIVATSGVKVTSKDAQTKIVSLRVQASGVDTTLDDPLRFFFLRRILRLDPDDQVTLTLTTLRNDDVVVLMFRDHRFRFHNNGDGTYTGLFRVPDMEGVRHFGVNALSHGTLFDDQAPYDSQAWLLPFLVRPNEIADELH